MPSTPNIPNSRNPLELKGDQIVATNEQIRQHCPELFENEFYLEPLRKSLNELCDFSSSNPLMSSLTPEDREKLNAFVADLKKRTESAFLNTPFEYAVGHESKNLDADGFSKEHTITVALGNIEALLKGAEKPMGDVDQLRKLSALIGHLLSETRRAEIGLPNFEEHNRRHEIEINVLKSELGELEEQEKSGDLTRAEQIQKEQLEKEIGEHGQAIARNSKKLNEKKDRVSAYKRQLSQTIQRLSGFLAQCNPNSPVSLSEFLNGLMATDKDVDLKIISAQAKAKEILSAGRTGAYTSYNPSLARAKRIEEKKRFLKKWGPRAAIFLLLSGAGLYATHERIKTALAHHLYPVAERILGTDETLRILQAEFDEELRSNPTELTLMKQKLLERWVESEVATNQKLWSELEGSSEEDRRAELAKRLENVPADSEAAMRLKRNLLNNIKYYDKRIVAPKLTSEDIVAYRTKLAISVLAAKDWKELIDIVIQDQDSFRTATVESNSFSVKFSESIIEVIRDILGHDSKLIIKVVNNPLLVYGPNKDPQLDFLYVLKGFSEVSDPPTLIFEKPLKGSHKYEVHSVNLLDPETFAEDRKIAKENSAKLETYLGDLKLLQSTISENPLVTTFREGLTEKDAPYTFGADFHEEVRSSGDLKDYLEKAIPKLEKNPKIIEYVKEQVKKGPHLAMADKGVDASQENISKFGVGAHVKAEDAVHGMVSLGIHEDFLTHLKNKLGPQANVEVFFWNENDVSTGISLKGEFHAMQIVLGLSALRRNCRVDSKLFFQVEVPFEDGSGNAQYAKFDVPMVLSQMEGSNKLVGYEGKKFCEELETFSIPGFNGSLTKLTKYLNPGAISSQKMAYATSADKVRAYLPEVLEQIKNNPQFKRDLEKALSEALPKIQFEHYVYDASGNFERRGFTYAPDTLPFGAETLTEKGSYLAFGPHASLIPQLEKFFGEGLVDVRTHGIVKEKVFCESESVAKLEVIIRLTPDHFFSVFYPIDLKKEGGSVRNEYCPNSKAQNAHAFTEAQELIDSVPLIALTTFSDVMSKSFKEPDALRMKEWLKAEQRWNDQVYGEALSKEIMNCYVVIGIYRNFADKVREKFGENAQIYLSTFSTRPPSDPDVLALGHIEPKSAFRIQALFDGNIQGNVKIVSPKFRSTFQIPISPVDLKTPDHVRLQNEAQYFAKLDWHSLIEKLRSKTDELSTAKIRVLDYLGDRLKDWQKFEILIGAKDLKGLRRFINNILPGCNKRVYVKNGRKMVHLESHPDTVKAMKLIYGKDTTTSLQFYVNGKPAGGFEFGKYQMELDIDFEDFCDFDNIASLIVTRKELYSSDTIWTPDFYNETCPDKIYKIRNPINTPNAIGDSLGNSERKNGK